MRRSAAAERAAGPASDARFVAARNLKLVLGKFGVLGALAVHTIFALDMRHPLRRHAHDRARAQVAGLARMQTTERVVFVDDREANRLSIRGVHATSVDSTRAGLTALLDSQARDAATSCSRLTVGAERLAWRGQVKRLARKRACLYASY
jgi:hypothetical protein